MTKKKLSTGAIEKFFERFNEAVKANSKDIRINISNANELVSAISLLLAQHHEISLKMIDIQDELILMQKKLPKDANTLRLSIDGGGFDESMSPKISDAKEE